MANDASDGSAFIFQKTPERLKSRKKYIGNKITNLRIRDVLAKVAQCPPLMAKWRGSMFAANQMVVSHENKLA